MTFVLLNAVLPLLNGAVQDSGQAPFFLILALSSGCLLANILWNYRQVEAGIQDYMAVGLPK